MSRSEWLEWRRHGIGASDIAGIVGLSPWATPVSVWVSKVMDATDDEPTDAMRAGNAAEPLILAMFEEQTASTVTDRQERVVHPDDPWIRATLDGRIDGALIEAKLTFTGPWEDIPAHYQCQGQWQMLATGADLVIFAVLHVTFGRAEFRTYPLARNEDDIALLRGAGEAFWTDHVTGGVAPEIDGSTTTAQALARRWPEDDGDPVEADQRCADLATELRTIKQQADDLAERRKAIEGELKAHMGEHAELVTSDGTTLATWKTSTSKRIDTKRLRAEQPDIADEFTTTASTRRFLLKTPKGATK